MSEEVASAKVQDALKKGYITPGMRSWATALCAQDPDSFDAFISTSVPAYAHLTRDNGHMKAPPPSARTGLGRSDDSDAAAAVCAQLGLPAGSLNL